MRVNASPARTQIWALLVRAKASDERKSAAGKPPIMIDACYKPSIDGKSVKASGGSSFAWKPAFNCVQAMQDLIRRN